LLLSKITKINFLKEVRLMKKKLIVLGLVAMMVLSVTYVYARGPGYGPGFKGEDWKGLSLTAEQKTKFHELRQKFNEETAQLRGALLTKRLELKSLWTNPKADSKTIMDKEKEVRNLQNQMKDKMIQLRLEARNFLTPEQIAEIGSRGGMGPGFGRDQRMGHGPRGGYGYGMGPGYGPCQ
jgi:Spy/CpxP family protein refolding chaperone